MKQKNQCFDRKIDSFVSEHRLWTKAPFVDCQQGEFINRGLQVINKKENDQ